MIRRSAALVLAVVIDVGAVSAEELCLAAPYQSGNAEIAALMALLTEALAGYPSLATAFRQEAPSLCISDALFHHALNAVPRIVAVLDGRGSAGTMPTEPASPAVAGPLAQSADSLRTALGLT